jgi:mono/diheme cytochrome c family protein
MVVMMVVGCGVAQGGISGQLSAERLYDDFDAKVIRSDAIELEPSFVLWSDGAAKRRWLVLPPGTQIDSSDMDRWQLPVGAKLFKEFSLGGDRIETRVVERVSNEDFRFAPFVWLPDQSDAVLAPDGATDVNGTAYNVPSSSDCVTCHQGETGRMLGVSAVQLGAMLDRLPLSKRPDRPIAIPEPALGVLHANCGHCHNPLGVAPMQTLRFSTADVGLPLEQTAPYQTTIGVALTDWTDQGFESRIVPGDPDGSAIFYRMSQRGSGDQMPPLGTERADDAGRAIVRDWIENL